MNTRAHSLHFLPLLALAAGCGQDPIEDGAPDAPGDDAQVRVEHVELQQLSITSDDAPAVLHPVSIQATITVNGPAFSGDVLVGLADADETGCILGAMELVHDGGEVDHELGSEFFLDRDCAQLIDEDHVEVFASFDPWGELEYAGRPDASNAGSMFESVYVQALPTDICDGCDTATTVSRSPGRDAQLRELALDSSVATVRFAATPGEVIETEDSRPQFAVSHRMRVTGLPKGEGLEDDSVGMEYRIRPLPGTDAAAELDADAQEFATLSARRKGEYLAVETIDASGQIDHNGASAVYIDGDVRDAMTDGVWSGVEEFELEACLVSSFDQAIYGAERGPRRNDCAQLPVVVLREAINADGSRALTPALELEAGANARTADVWSTGWSTSSQQFGTTGFNMQLWVDVNSSDTPSSTYGGHSVDYPGSWFEAGANATGTVFDTNATLADFYASFIGYNGGGGKVYLGAQLLGYDFISPIALDTTSGVTLTLQNILDAAGSNASPVFEKDISIVGFSFDDGCGSVNSGIWGHGEIGIDTDETSVTFMQTPNIVKVSATVAPYAKIQAVAGAAVAYGDFLRGSLTATVDLINAMVPFTAMVAVNTNSGGITLTESADLVLSALSGDITFETYWKSCFLWCWEVEHSHELVSWTGLENTYNLFELSQDIGGGAGDFCDLYDGQQVHFSTYHGQYMQAYNSSLNYEVRQGPNPYAWETFTVECQPNGKVAFRTYHNRYLQALGGGVGAGVNQQTFVGGWEEYEALLQGNGTWAFRTFHNTYLQAHADGHMSQQSFVGGWEQFVLE